VTSEVEAVVPEQLWTRVQEMLVRRRKDRLAPQRYAGGYVLTELLRCACGSPMVGTSNRSYRYYRCKARCGRPSVRANDLDAGVMDLIRRGWLQLSDARYVVLDEADEMLSLGFMEDVEWILKKTPSGRQTLLFSATMPAPIRKLADRYLYEPVHVKVESATLTVETIDQVIVEVEPNRKLDVLCAILERDRPAASIVFRRRKMTVDELVAQLGARGIDAVPLHGDMPQGRRDGVMLRFRSGRARLLVATNVAARGLAREQGSE